MRLPRASSAADTRVTVTQRQETACWHRTFGNRSLATRQYRTAGGQLGERIGVFEFRFRLEAAAGSLVFRQVDAAIVCGPVRVRMPAAWTPRIDAREDPAGPDRVHVQVRVELPACGPLLTYEGTVEIEGRR